MSRFGSATKADIQDLHDQKDSLNTKKSVNHSVKVVREYCKEKGSNVEFEKLDPKELDELLELFYVDVRKKDGELYKSSAFSLLRYGINKHLLDSKKLDIPNDPAFANSNKAYFSVCAKLKKEGLALKTHKECISSEDLDILYRGHHNAFNVNTPIGLLQKCWFEVMFFLCRRGRENLRDMTVDSIAITLDNTGLEYAYQAKDELVKNHRKADDPSSQGRMYAIPGKSCYVRYSKVI